MNDGRFGPVSGRGAKHLFVLAGAGVVESTDGRATWSEPAPLPKDFKGVSPLTWLDKAVAGGAREVHPVEEMHGRRAGRVADPFGHHWEIGRPVAS